MDEFQVILIIATWFPGANSLTQGLVKTSAKLAFTVMVVYVETAVPVYRDSIEGCYTVTLKACTSTAFKSSLTPSPRTNAVFYKSHI